jgi:hypothetical protein
MAQLRVSVDHKLLRLDHSPAAQTRTGVSLMAQLRVSVDHKLLRLDHSPAAQTRTARLSLRPELRPRGSPKSVVRFEPA